MKALGFAALLALIGCTEDVGECFECRLPAPRLRGAPVGEATFDSVFSAIIEGSGCSGCRSKPHDHVDLSDEATAFASLVTDRAKKCGDKPYVTPGQPDASSWSTWSPSRSRAPTTRASCACSSAPRSAPPSSCAPDRSRRHAVT